MKKNFFFTFIFFIYERKLHFSKDTEKEEKKRKKVRKTNKKRKILILEMRERGVSY